MCILQDKMNLKIILKWEQEHLKYFFTFHKTKLNLTLLHNAYIRLKLEAHRLSSLTIKTWTTALTQNIMANQMDVTPGELKRSLFNETVEAFCGKTNKERTI